MAAFTPANSIGWAAGDPVTSAQMNKLDQDHVKTINIVDGLATYNPAGLIQIGGAGFRWNGPTLFSSTSATDVEGAFDIQSATGRLYVKTSGQIVVQTTGEIVIQTGGAIAVQTGGDLIVESGGAMNWEDGSLITAEDGSTFQFADGSVANFGGIMNFGATSEIHGDPRLMSGAELTFMSGSVVTAASGSTTAFSAGSTMNLGGTSTLTNSQTLALSPARAWVRHSLRISMVSYVASSGTPANNDVGPANPAAWISNHTTPPETGFETPFIRTVPTNTNTHGEQHYHWIALDDLPHNGTFSQVVVTSIGFNTPTTTAKFRVVRVNSAGTVENMSDLTDKSGTWTSSTQTTVSINAHATISTAYRYALVVLHPLLTGGGAGSAIHIFNVESSGTIASMAIG